VKKLIQFIEKISADTNDIQRVSELEHCFEIMVCLLAGRDPKLLLEELAVLLGRQLSNLTEQRIFKLLIALCEGPAQRNRLSRRRLFNGCLASHQNHRTISKLLFYLSNFMEFLTVFMSLPNACSTQSSKPITNTL
jgi:hypothetical protein